MPGEEKKCPCDNLLNVKKDIREHGDRLHRGDITLAEINLKLEAIDKRFDTVDKRFDKFEEKFDKQSTEQSNKIDNQFKELTDKILCIELKPAKRWDGLVTAGIGAIVGAIVSAIAMMLNAAG